MKNANVWLLCSESRRLGASLGVAGGGQERVPQVPEALHLLRTGEDRRQANLVLILSCNVTSLLYQVMFRPHWRELKKKKKHTRNLTLKNKKFNILSFILWRVTRFLKVCLEKVQKCWLFFQSNVQYIQFVSIFHYFFLLNIFLVKMHFSWKMFTFFWETKLIFLNYSLTITVFLPFCLWKETIIFITLTFFSS